MTNFDKIIFGRDISRIIRSTRTARHLVTRIFKNSPFTLVVRKKCIGHESYKMKFCVTFIKDNFRQDIWMRYYEISIEVHRSILLREFSKIILFTTYIYVSIKSMGITYQYFTCIYLYRSNSRCCSASCVWLPFIFTFSETLDICS